MAVAMPVVVEWDDFVFKNIQQRLGFFTLPSGGIVVRFVRRDGPAVLPVVPFAPPTIQNTEINDAIDTRFLAGCPARFEWIFRCVEPHIDTGDQFARERNIVTFEHNQSAFEFGATRKVVDNLNEMLARLVMGMRFAGENQNNRTLGIAQ